MTDISYQNINKLGNFIQQFYDCSFSQKSSKYKSLTSFMDNIMPNPKIIQNIQKKKSFNELNQFFVQCGNLISTRVISYQKKISINTNFLKNTQTPKQEALTELTEIQQINNIEDKENVTEKNNNLQNLDEYQYIRQSKEAILPVQKEDVNLRDDLDFLQELENQQTGKFLLDIEDYQDIININSTSKQDSPKQSNTQLAENQDLNQANEQEEKVIKENLQVQLKNYQQQEFIERQNIGENVDFNHDENQQEETIFKETLKVDNQNQEFTEKQNIGETVQYINSENNINNILLDNNNSVNIQNQINLESHYTEDYQQKPILLTQSLNMNSDLQQEQHNLHNYQKNSRDQQQQYQNSDSENQQYGQNSPESNHQDKSQNSYNKKIQINKIERLNELQKSKQKLEEQLKYVNQQLQEIKLMDTKTEKKKVDPLHVKLNPEQLSENKKLLKKIKLQQLEIEKKREERRKKMEQQFSIEIQQGLQLLDERAKQIRENRLKEIQERMDQIKERQKTRQFILDPISKSKDVKLYQKHLPSIRKSEEENKKFSVKREDKKIDEFEAEQQYGNVFYKKIIKEESKQQEQQQQYNKLIRIDKSKKNSSAAKDIHFPPIMDKYKFINDNVWATPQEYEESKQKISVAGIRVKNKNDHNIYSDGLSDKIEQNIKYSQNKSHKYNQKKDEGFLYEDQIEAKLALFSK